MWDFDMGRAAGLLLRTLPFIVLRCAVYFGMALAYVLVTGIGAGIGWGVGALGTRDFQASATAWGALAGFGITGLAIYLARQYILYMVKAGHIAVLVELLDGRALPDGRGQIGHGAQVVRERFAQANVLFGLDLLIKGVIRAVSSIVRGVLNFLPIPGTQQLMRVFQAFMRVAVGLVDEVILAHAIRSRSDNAWASAQTALVLYGQNAKVLLKNAAWLTVFIYGLSLLVFVVMLAPAAALSWLMPGGWSALSVLFALVLAWAVKAALLEPFALACLLQVYFKVTEGQTPDPAWEQRLDGVSRQFREIKAKATAWGTGQGPGPDAQGPAPQAPVSSSSSI